MGQICSSVLPHRQPAQAHESQSQPRPSSFLVDCPPTNSDSINQPLSAVPQSPPPPKHSNDAVLPGFPSLPPLYPPSLFRKEIAILSAQAKRDLAVRRKERRRAKKKSARLMGNRRKMKENATLLLQEAGMQHELRRAEKAATSPNHFPSIDVHREEGEDHDDDEDEDARLCQQTTIAHDRETSRETKATRTEAFAGLITIQDCFSAMSQAISEHAKGSTLPAEPGRHSFHVDAAVSHLDRLTGIAVVHRQCWASKWTATGYRIKEALDTTDAEAWAIYQALQLVLDKVRADRAIAKPEYPCSVAVVYSDCMAALQWIESGLCNDRKVVRKIIALSVQLRQLGVDVHLHWVPGHRGVPGNELADLVSKRARRPFD